MTEQQPRHPLDKYTTARLFDAIGTYFRAGATARRGKISPALAQAELLAASGENPIGAVLTATPTLRQEVTVVLTLAHCGEAFGQRH